MSGRGPYWAGAVVLLFVLALGVRLAWFPSPKEAGYRFEQAWGRSGSGPGELARPMHLDVYEGRLYVAEYLNDRVSGVYA